MAERELVDKTHLLEEIKELQKSPWYNRGKNDMAVAKGILHRKKRSGRSGERFMH